MPHAAVNGTRLFYRVDGATNRTDRTRSGNLEHRTGGPVYEDRGRFSPRVAITGDGRDSGPQHAAQRPEPHAFGRLVGCGRRDTEHFMQARA